MKVYEFGTDREQIFVMFQCAAEPWWAFQASAEAMARDYHVYLFMTDGHDELGTEFVSIEKTVKDAAGYLREQDIRRVDAMYGVSMGGAIVIRFLATEDLPVEKAVIDGGITPYPYPKLLCRLISVKDWIMVMLGTRFLPLMKLAYPPERWTPEGEDPQEHYRRLRDFYRKHFSAKTIYHVFWSTDNYSMPDPVPAVGTKIEYWYGEHEKKAREKEHDIAYVRSAYPQTVLREFKGLEHAELVMMYPERFYREVTEFLESGNAKYAAR
ncbi:MAG: alpha/beta hydrolase [Oscillospiraceae bacterium]|nr:alpha/beta hydrolase [Oscillospiraceae bacterium]